MEPSFASYPIVAGSRIAAVVKEASSHDWNGDGDQSDDVWVAIDSASGQVLHAGFAAQPIGALGLPTTTGMVYAFVSESAQGGLDLNGDGDSADFIPARFDTTTGAVWVVPNISNWRLVAGDGSRVLVEIDESVGNDLNLDNDVLDHVLHDWNPTNGVTTNLGLAIQNVAFLPAGELIVEAPEFVNSQDWSGDGDVVDIVIRQLHSAGPNWLTTPFEGTVDAVSDSFVAVSELESTIGLDRNHDGDFADRIVSSWNAATKLPILGSLSGSKARVSGGRIVFIASEANSGATDLNGDGDAVDLTLTVMNALTGGVSFIPEARGPAGALSFVFSGTRVAYPTSEPWLAGVGLPADRNGDGDHLDLVMTVRDLATGATHFGRAIQGSPGYALAGEFVVYNALESAEGATDIDSNGTKNGSVFVIDEFSSDSRPAFSGPSQGSSIWLPGGTLGSGRRVVSLSEAVAKHDWNQDGDLTDSVAFDFDLKAHTVRNLGVATNYVAGSSTYTVLSVSEAGQNADLNGDGDTTDSILHGTPSAPGQSGTVMNYGGGCPTASGKPARLDVYGELAPGGSVVTRASGATPGSSAWFVIGSAVAATPVGLGCPLLVALPISGPIGPFAMVPNGIFASAWTSFSELPLGVPANTQIYLQAFLQDATLGLVPTNGIEITTG